MVRVRGLEPPEHGFLDRSLCHSGTPAYFGAIDETRTRDLFLTKEVLYQLSYDSLCNRKVKSVPLTSRPIFIYIPQRTRLIGKSVDLRSGLPCGFLVRKVGVEPNLVTIKSRVPSR